MKTIMFDVDGVLANFCYGFLKEAGILNPWGHKNQPAWEFNLPKELQDNTWKKVTNTHWWWFNLPIEASKEDLHNLFLLRKQLDYQVVFCTNRIGVPNPQIQTQLWLQEKCGILNPAVILSKRKGDVARAIEADYAIDDKAENVACIHWIADVRPCKAYILDRPYNRNFSFPKAVRRVYSISEFIEDIRKGN